MKKMNLSIAACVVALLLTVAGCKKDSNNGMTCGGGLLCATVDGTSYTATPYNSSSSGFLGLNTSYNGSYAQLIPSSTSTGGYYMVVSGNNGTANNGATWQIDFTITQLPVAGGTYSTQAGSASFEYFAGSSSNQNKYTTDSSHSGTVTISHIDTTASNPVVSGTFSYTAYETGTYTPTTHTVTSGSFTNVLIRR